MAGIEIAELKDALAYTELLLSKNMQEKEDLLRKDNEHLFEVREVENKARNFAEGKIKAENQIKILEGKVRQQEEIT